MRRTHGWLFLAVGALGCSDPALSGARPAAETTPGEAVEPADPMPPAEAPPALPAEIEARVHLPGEDASHLYARVSLAPLPWVITGCLAARADAPCAPSTRVELGENDRRELVELLAEVWAIPRCEPFELGDDRGYSLVLTGSSRPYVGTLPSDPSRVAARNEGPCRADARLAWWIASRFRAR
jgi:hypothetical protein